MRPIPCILIIYTPLGAPWKARLFDSIRSARRFAKGADGFSYRILRSIDLVEIGHGYC